MIDSPNAFLIHGWGANHHIFDDLRTQLGLASSHWQTPDLPGHGLAPLIDNEFDINTIAELYASKINQPVHVLGWSLGGMVALVLAANYPTKVKTLCLTASLAKLTASNDYPEGLQQVILTSMVTQFEQHYARSMQQFLTLQLLTASAQQQDKIQQLLPAVCQYGAPTGLTAALNALAHTDLRPLLSKIQVPTLLIFGGRDAITPVRMGQYLHQHIPHSQWQLIPQAAHAPFLSHPDLFSHSLSHFWECHS